MRVADENLRNRASIGARNHFFTEFRIVFNVDFVENHTLPSQQILDSRAVRTPIRQVYRHHRPAHLELAFPPDEDFTRGKLSFVQELSPPCRLNTLVKPSLVSVRAPLAPVMPLSQ